nr:uncharacterized protein LOC117840718 [Setaria viridis]
MAASFLKRRVQPLQLRQTWGYEYSGFDDPSLMSVEDISDDVVEDLLGKFFNNFQGVPKVDESIQEFDKWYKPREEDVFSYFSPPPPDADGAKNAKFVHYVHLPDDPSEEEDGDYEVHGDSDIASPDSELSDHVSVQSRVLKGYKFGTNTSKRPAGDVGDKEVQAPMLKKRWTIVHKRLVSKHLEMFKAPPSVVDDTGEDIEDVADAMYGAVETTSDDVVVIAKDAAASVVSLETSAEDAAMMPETATTQVAINLEVVSGGAGDPLETSIGGTVKTPEAVSDATLPEVHASGLSRIFFSKG